MEKDSEGIKVLYPKAQSCEFITAELLLLILNIPIPLPSSCLVPEGELKSAIWSKIKQAIQTLIRVIYY